MAASAKQIIGSILNSNTANPIGIAKNVISTIDNNRTSVKVGDYKPSTPVGQFLADPADALANYLNKKKDSPLPSYPTGGGSAISSSVVEPLEYIDAPLAEAYGMDAATAYQEALSNNAVRRRMNDLKAAGLNPVLGVSGSGATSFYGTPLEVASGGASSFGGVSYGSSGSGKTTSGLLDKLGTQLKYNLPTLIGGAVGLATKNPANAYYGSQLGSAIGNIIKYF